MSDGAQPASESAISIHYDPASDDTEAAMLELLRRTRFLELLVSIVEARFDFPEPLELVLEQCGSPNAYWDPENRQVVLCYELMTTFAKVADREEVTQLVERFRGAR